ncbi:unnamed protein product [Fraxinus pennsylvanica]|uniref:Uncharacterized protein n=1 Tax=Fraxinus pennsylvanica TaxID=56036 RepID=A0AAD2A2M1_9LAMI|nr:unnamed protein product [Fraxinus pennsylvanica]
MVKNSVALNHPGAENMKPRQFSDAKHKEIGEKVMSQIFDGVWNIIRSGDGMKTEIVETVQSVYNKLSNPGGNNHWETSSHVDLQPVGKTLENNVHAIVSVNDIDATVTNGEQNEPPGKRNKRSKRGKLVLTAILEPDNLESGPPPGFSSILEHKQSGDPNDEDPDVPPGFG